MLRLIRFVLLFSLCLFCSQAVLAQVPQTFSYQGFVRDDAGAPIDGVFEVTFSLYSGPDEFLAPVWASKRPINFNQGVFQANLGELTPFGASLFITPQWLGITVHPQDETPTGPQAEELSPRQPLSSVPYAMEAANSQLIGGQSAAALDQSSHVADTDNPHGVTAEQIQAIGQVALDAALLTKADAVHQHDALYYRKSEVDAIIQPLIAANAALTNRIAVIENLDFPAQIQALQTQITALQNAGGGSDLDAFVRVSGTDIFIEGANLHVNNGSGTQTSADGLGNLIVGYNPGALITTGSHNLIVGAENNFSSTGGLVSGFRNSVDGANSAIVGGFGNTTSNSQSVSVGGVQNTSSGFASVTIAGSNTQASGGSSLSAGGSDGIAQGTFSVRLGGDNSTALGREAVAIGGRNNTAAGPFSLVAGGESNAINSSDPNNSNNLEGNASVILGGKDNQLNSWRALIAGGDGNSIDATSSGTRGQNATIVGGNSNSSSGNNSLIAGGESNAIEGNPFSALVGRNSSVFGGVGNRATGGRDVALIGGKNNTGAVSNVLVLGGDGQSGDIVNSVAVAGLNDFGSLFAGVSRTGDDLIFSGLNLWLNNGTGETETVNSLGNLTIGYNEERGSNDDRSGSHNLILGRDNNFTSRGSLIVGRFNDSNGRHNAILGTFSSVASESYASIFGGFDNQASGTYSSAVGGRGANASGENAAVLGGLNNQASELNSTAVGGEGNTASGSNATTLGGRGNQAGRNQSTVRGGRNVSTEN